VEERRLLDHRVLSVVPALVPFLIQMRKSLCKVLQALGALLVVFLRVRENAVAEHELLQTDKHASFLQLVGVTTLLLHSLKTLVECVIKHLSDVFVHSLVKALFVLD